MEKIVIQNLVKIFGDKPEKALRLLRQGQSKKDILAETGQAVGVADVSFTVEAGEIMAENKKNGKPYENAKAFLTDPAHKALVDSWFAK